MDSKLFLRLSTICISLLIIIAPMTAQAMIYEIKWYQNPATYNVREMDLITVSMVLDVREGETREQVYDTWYSPTEIRWEKDGERQSDIKCNQVLPGFFQMITFTMGSFFEGVEITYTVHLGLDNCNDYKSSEIYFYVESLDVPREDEDEPGLITEAQKQIMMYTGIGVGVLIVLFLLFKKQRSKNKE